MIQVFEGDGDVPRVRRSRDVLREIYRTTTFQRPVGDDWVPFEPARKRVVITAWNPFSTPLTMQENIKRDAVLRMRIQSLALDHTRVRGSSPDMHWYEDGWAVEHSATNTLDLLREFEQDAAIIFTPLPRPTADRTHERTILWHNGAVENLA